MIKSSFDIFNDVLTKKSGGTLHLEPEFNKVCSNFMLCRIASMRNELTPLISILNKYQSRWTTTEMYLFLYKNIKQTSNVFTKYIKNPKKETVKEKSKKERGYIII